jgi:hypothetical protein
MVYIRYLGLICQDDFLHTGTKFQSFGKWSVIVFLFSLIVPVKQVKYVVIRGGGCKFKGG